MLTNNTRAAVVRMAKESTSSRKVAAAVVDRVLVALKDEGADDDEDAGAEAVIAEHDDQDDDLDESEIAERDAAVAVRIASRAFVSNVWRRLSKQCLDDSCLERTVSCARLRLI